MGCQSVGPDDPTCIQVASRLTPTDLRLNLAQTQTPGLLNLRRISLLAVPAH